MKKNTSMKWRLSALPTPSEVRELVGSDIISKEEARQILFSTEEDRDGKSLKEEIKFLRDLVEKLSENKMSRIVEVIKEIPAYERYPWHSPYTTWTDGVSGSDYFTPSTATNFSDIKTF